MYLATLTVRDVISGPQTFSHSLTSDFKGRGNDPQGIHGAFIYQTNGTERTLVTSAVMFPLPL
jgi:hypothetical protein